MMKKLLSFVCCLLPVGAGAVTVNSHTPGANASYGGDGNLTSVNVDANTVEVITNGNGIVISKDSGGNSGGLVVANDLIVGQDYEQIGGNLYAGAATNTPFTIQSDGDIDVTGQLYVLTGRRLDITPKTTGTAIDATFGSIAANGALNIQNVNQFKSGGTLTSATALSLYANTINAGAINVTGGTSDIRATSIESGNIQNNGTDMTIVLTGGLTTLNKGATNIGSIENSGTSMDIAAGAVSVAGTMKNDSNVGTLTMNVASLSVVGGGLAGGATTIAPSFVNKGNLYLTVTGETDLAYGFDLSGMGASNVFSLTTGTLKIASAVTDSTDLANALAQVYHNNLDSFKLVVTDGMAGTGSVINGETNNAATMTVTGKFVDATSVTNYGTVNINATGTPGATDDPAYALNVSGDIESKTVASVTNIVSASSLNVAGTVSNAGNMLINGKEINLVGVVNDGAGLDIKAGTDASGVIKISSTVTNNDGVLTINARQIDISGGVTNVAGTTTISGSDGTGGAISLGGIDVRGGAFNLDALVDSVSVVNAIDVGGGVLNVGQNTHVLTTGAKIAIDGNVNLVADAATSGNGDVNIMADGPSGFLLSSTATDDADGVIHVAGNVLAVADDSVSRSMQFDAKTITVDKDATAENQGKLIFGRDGRVSLTTIAGDATANNGGALEFYSDTTNVGILGGDGLFKVHGTQIIATTGAINIDGNLWFAPGTGIEYTTGMLVTGTDTLTLKTLAVDADIDITGGATITADNALTLDSAHDATIGGIVKSDGVLSVTAAADATFGNAIETNRSLTVYARNITTKDITNTGNMILGDAQHVASDIIAGAITNSGTVTINGVTVGTTDIESTDGAFDVTADSLNTGYITVSGGTMTLDSTKVVAVGNIDVSGNLFQGTPNASNVGMLNVVHNNSTVSAANLKVAGFNALGNSVGYELSGNVTVDGAFGVASAANVTMIAGGAMTSGALTNAGGLTLGVNGTDGLTFNGAIENTGILSLLVNGLVTADSFVVNTGKTTLMGDGMTLTGAFGAADKSSMLYHGDAPTMANGDFRIMNSGYAITASNVALAGIGQTAGKLTINTSDLKIANDIDVIDMRVAANPATNWLSVDVGGNVFGGAQFIGLESMHVGGNYRFDNNSQINAAILPYATGNVPNTTTRNYWSTVSLNDDNTLGQITNAADGAALIQVDGKFVSSADAFNVATNGGELGRPQVGLVLRDIVDPGTAIWLLHADGGVSDDSLAGKIRNLNVSFCNADGTECFDYLGTLKDYNGAGTDLPAYISVRDSLGDGAADSLYVVFDPRFGGPVEVFKIQPIVARTDDYTAGEYTSAGAIDNLIAGQLATHGFRNRTPIEAIPVIFKNTNLSTAANELYSRMEQYNLDRDGAGLARFSRLFQPREVEQIAGSIVLNEHTTFRSFEDRMFDEFIWNRNRNLKKAWLDVDYGIFYQDATDSKHIDGTRFNISGGFDWQESQTLLLGLTGRVSRTSSDNSDDVDLGYMPGQHIAGHVKTKVADTDIGLGAYLVKTLGQKMRVYGNGFLDIHVLDIKREQNYVSKISGDGTAFSLTSEWGLLHDWLNQYIVGNLYTRVGYNFGFDVTERAAGQDYMNMKSDGYFTFTPGYSLTAQKRIYPSVWFQVRPYATIGVEYDVLGAPDSVKYKFAAANNYTEYDVNIDPLWANIGGGVEMLSVTGVQVGIDYRYQYNADMQMHNIRISGSYRF